ncbi:hypothetical protein PHISCL_09799 [Aspergillus sclerotialis]|uniref:Peptidase family M20/M25/M40 protein n=1 Tax=Aspergillus sclerotialis TaxID=2070753 RepID=A0A3A2ZJ16_9EURO|nr:hypothetical protein PHISCL_09799 [Aspergillus sclerotialis]
MTDISHPQPSVSERRGQRLTPLNTNFSRPTTHSSIPAPRPQRPRPADYENSKEAAAPEPLQSPTIKRQSSKPVLRGLFGREKAGRKSDHDRGLTHIEETQQTVTQGSNGLDAPLSPSTCATPKTVVSTPTLLSSPQTSYLTKPPPVHRAETSDSKSGNDPNWKPPPLFQAYPQAIKHDCLAAPTLSSDSILRIHENSRGHLKNQQNQAGNAELGDRSGRKKKDEKKKHIRSLSETIGKTEWTRKIYVLATSGYILQYAGDGKHDRLPEKMLKLGPKTVAFASDAIPGKHWVLQVSQNSDDNMSTPAEIHRPFLSRFGFHRPHTRRIARGFLLVLNSPEELSTWLLAVRAEIEARGGKKYVSERVFDDGEDAQLRAKPNVRQMVHRDPNRFSNVFLQPAGTSEELDHFGMSSQSRRSSYHSFNRRSVVTTESRSGSTSTGRTDGVAPTNITEPSFASSNNGSLSFPENAASSPPIATDAAAHGTFQEDMARSQTQSPPVSSPKQRQSMLMYSKVPTNSSEASQVPRAQSAASKPLIRSTSPPAPNFSVPSFSNRFAAKIGPTRLSQIPRQDNYEPSIAAFPSPPQSPTRNTPGFDRKESVEHMSPPRKPLRVSTSDASLGSLAEYAKNSEPKPQTFAQIPEPVPVSSSPPQNPNIATGSVNSSNRQSQHILSNPRDQPQRQLRNRMSILHQNSSVPSAPNRRKSMPGLTGPPVAPPPNCPLPKIPSPVTANQPLWPVPSASGSPPPLRNARDHRTSTINPAADVRRSSRAVFREI